MKKKIKTMIPILIAFVLAFTIVTVAWIVQDAQLKGIRITSTTDGVTLKIKPASDSHATPTDTVTLTDMEVTLKPCVYDGTAFYDEDGNLVTNNRQYVRTFSIQVLPEQTCILKATKAVTGDLPVNIVCNGTEVTDFTDLGRVESIGTFTFSVYVDGANFTGQATSDVTITLHGDNV